QGNKPKKPGLRRSPLSRHLLPARVATPHCPALQHYLLPAEQRGQKGLCRLVQRVQKHFESHLRQEFEEPLKVQSPRYAVRISSAACQRSNLLLCETSRHSLHYMYAVRISS